MIKTPEVKLFETAKGSDIWTVEVYSEQTQDRASTVFYGCNPKTRAEIYSNMLREGFLAIEKHLEGEKK